MPENKEDIWSERGSVLPTNHGNTRERIYEQLLRELGILKKFILQSGMKECKVLVHIMR